MRIKEQSYHLLRRLTSPRFRQALKGRVWHVRSKLAPVLQSWHGTYGAEQLEAELRVRLPDDFEILMVHSSISDMQPMYKGSASELLQLLLRLAGPERTLGMPAFYLGSAELYHRDYYRKNPRFDVRRTPSQMGLVTELFRRWPGVVRSLHPTHSVCTLGPLSGELVATHHLSPWPCGELSPFGVMGRHKTVILGIGTEYYRSLTQVHAMEEILGDRFPIPREAEDPVRVELVDRGGKKLPYAMGPPLSRGATLKLERLNDLAPGSMRQWKFRGTTLYLTTAAEIDTAIRNAALGGHTLYELGAKRSPAMSANS